ncbi:MAG: hypothetical protein KAJ29_06820, partial [Alphaproteobacteria bacterium]|nr:hypothetical protein [Alphaproteobacteria bacterium]
DEPTVRTGVYAMLLNRQKGLACLEIKTLSGQFKDIPLWTILNFYCEASLPGENSSRKDKKDDFSQYSILDAILESPDYVYEYDPKDFAALSMIERAALCAQGSISTKYITPQTIAKIPPEHISILLAQPSLSDLQKALLLGAAIDHAIEPPEAMTAFYKELLEKQKQEKKIEGQTTAPGPSTPTATDELLIIAQLYEETTENWLGTARAEKISRAIALAHKHSDKLMIPFLPVISKLDIEKDISLEDALDIVHLYLYTPQKISKTWINDLLKIDYSDQPQQEIAREKLLISLFLLYENDKSALKNKMYNNISTKPLRSGLIKDVRNIIENIDITPINSDKVRMKDINGFDLGKDKRYTMPPYHVLSTLKQASENQDISVSLLLSACILSKIDKQDMYIGTLGNIASALSNVGIKIAPRHIVAEALMQAGKGQKTKTEELLRR